MTLAVIGPAGTDAAGLRRSLAAAAPDLTVEGAEHPAPEVALLALDAVCPVRPDDLAVAARVARRVPLVVALTGIDTAPRWRDTAATTRTRLAAAGITTDVVPWSPDAPLDDLLAAVHSARKRPPDDPPPPGPTDARDGSSSDTGPTPDRVADWLAARRTDALTGRSAALRQDVHALRLERARATQRAFRALSTAGRERLRSGDLGGGRGLDELTGELDERADAEIERVLGRTEELTRAVTTRHLGPAGTVHTAPAAPTAEFAFSAPPRHRGEEALMLVMGLAGGAGTGRLLLTPFEHVPGIALVVLPVVVVLGLALGLTTVAVRRTHTLRTHLVGEYTEQLAALRSDVDHHVGGRILSAEQSVTDGFAHHPGPRAADLDRRIQEVKAAAGRASGRPSGR